MTYDQWLDVGDPANDPSDEGLEELDDLYEEAMDRKRMEREEDDHL
jgi:hypothetical protein